MIFFSISSNGNILYFADIFGTVTALKVATFPAPAPIAPVAVPVSLSTLAPTLSPTNMLLESPSPMSASPLSIIENIPTEYPSQSFASQKNSGNPDLSSVSRNEDSGSKKQIIIFSLVGIVLFFSLLAAVFFCLLIRKRLKARNEDIEIEKEAEAQRKWRKQKKELEEECKRKEKEVLEEIITVQTESPETPQKAPNEVPVKLEERTPETLASIQELANEDISVTPSFVEDDDTESLADENSGMATSLGTNSTTIVSRNTSDTNGLKYLPVALAAKFDKMVGDIGIGGISASSVVKSVVGDVVNETENFLDTDRPWVHASVNSRTRPDDDSSIGSASMFIDGDEESLRSGSVNETSQPGKIKTKRQVEEPKEPENDAWTKIMSSLIDVEKQFFNPNFGKPKKAASEVKSVDENKKKSQDTSEASGSKEVTLSSTLESNTEVDPTVTDDSDHMPEAAKKSETENDPLESSTDLKVENNEMPPASVSSPGAPGEENCTPEESDQQSSSKVAGSSNPETSSSKSLQEKPFDEDNRLNTGSRSIIL
jgi:hypothetical protein